MPSIRVRHRTLGGHVHATVFSTGGELDTTHSKCGDLVFRVGADWDAFHTALSRGADSRHGDDIHVQFIDDTDGSSC